MWFRRILLADSFCLPVLEKAVEILLSKRRATGGPHAMLVRALNIPHVHRVAKVLAENFPQLEGRVGLIHSDHDTYDLAGRPSEILQSFYRGDLWVLVHCGMVGVGFDHPWVSVSCCLCVLKSLSPAEQEWGRAIRRVPGEPPGDFPQLDHPNWAVVVTHEALGIRPLFEEFLRGKQGDTISEVPSLPKPQPVLTRDYEAGETVLSLSDTSHLKPGDNLQLSLLVPPTPAAAPKFDLASELGDGPLQEPVHHEGETDAADSHPGREGLPTGSMGKIPPAPEALPWEREVEAIASKLEEIRTVRTLSVQVEAVLDDHQVQIAPIWSDLPRGVAAKIERSRPQEPDTNFLSHVNLDWQVMVEDKLISFAEYKKQVFLKNKGLELNEQGEICSGGVPLRETMPPGVYEVFLRGLESELEDLALQLPHAPVVARPDKAKMDVQAKYGAKIRGLIHDLFRQRNWIEDGANGNSLIVRPVKLLTEAITRVEEKGLMVDFQNNQQLIHAAVFGHIKEKTGRRWSEHNQEQYQEAYQLARVYLNLLREQIRWQPRRRN